MNLLFCDAYDNTKLSQAAVINRNETEVLTVHTRTLDTYPDPHMHPDLVLILYTHPDPAYTLEPPYTPIVTVLGEQI